MENDNDKQLKDIINLKTSGLSFADIQLIANGGDVKKRYEDQYHGHLYSKILLLLTHKSYKESEAELLWNEIMCHMQNLNHKLGREVGVSVATLDYLYNLKNKLSDPIIIEEDKSEFISKSTTKDELTGLYLRAVFDVVLKQNIEETNRNGTPLSLLMMDIDDFKNINDKYGHLEGDYVLKTMGAALNESARKMDFAVRYGGEEFAIIMSKVDKDEAYEAAERIREVIAQLQFKEYSITISIGLSQADCDINTPDKLIHAADTALYEAKNKGKNCVVVAARTS